MYVGEVIGNVWGESKHPTLDKWRLLLVRPVDPVTEKPLGEAVMAIDSGVGAAPGSIVLVIDEGGSARTILGDKNMPVRTVICGIVDSVTMRGKTKRYA